MITLSMKQEERPIRIMPKEGFVYQNTKGNYFMVIHVDDAGHGVKGITFSSVSGKMMEMHTYAFHCVCKWPLIGRAVDMPQIEVVEISSDEIQSLEKYRGII